MKLSDLLQQNECEWLDFKQEFHDNNVKLLHDIICLANTNTDADRYLFFGVDDNKNIVGIENDKNKKTSADIQDLLKNSNFNKIPKVRLDYIKIGNNHEIGVLSIFDKPDKPYFLTKDKHYGKYVLRAGVVYTRIGDTNIPLNESAPDGHIEQMWKERFGIDLPPLKRVSVLLEQPDAWEEIGTDGSLYHRDFPDYKIVDGKELNSNFVEEWSEKFRDPHASSFYVELWHKNTILKKSVFVWVDGARYKVPLPERTSEGKWKINKDSIEFKIAKLFKQYYPLEKILRTKGVEIE